jgi:hypothetical protein
MHKNTNRGRRTKYLLAFAFIVIAFIIPIASVFAPNSKASAVTIPQQTGAPLPNYSLDLVVHLSPSTTDKTLTLTATRQGTPPGTPLGTNGPTTVTGGIKYTTKTGCDGHCNNNNVPVTNTYDVLVQGNNRVYAATAKSDQIAACSDSHSYNSWVVTVNNSQGQKIGWSDATYVNCDPNNGNNNGNISFTFASAISIYQGCNNFSPIAVGQDLSQYNYNCPDGKTSIQDGVLKDTTITPSPKTPSADTGTNENTQCEVSLTSPLTWILCPVFNIASDFSHFLLQNVVEPSLITTPISLNASQPNFKVWSTFRNYGDAVLVVALLVVIIAEAIGGGVFEAYEVRKMLPRILVAAILINLSIYIVAAAVDISNIIGIGISDAITYPFQQAGLLHVDLSSTQQVGAFGMGLIGLFAGGAAISGVILGVAAGITGFLSAGIGFVFFAILPVILGAMALWATLVIRKGLIVFLVIVSPIAFALYCLPNTEQYFKKWWKLLIETLMVFPIIMIIAAVADILSVLILNGSDQTIPGLNGNQNVALTATNAFATLTAFILQFAPLMAAPFAFKIAGGVLGKVNEYISSGAQRINKMADHRRQQEKRKYNSYALQSRQKYLSKLQDVQSNTKTRGITRGLAKFGAARIGGYNMEAAMSESRAQWGKEINDQINTGKDDEIRGLTVNKSWADNYGKKDQDWRVTDDNKKQYRTLGGAWVDEAAVDAGQGRWGNNSFVQQAALSYEMRKASTEGELQRLGSHYSTVANSWGMDDQQAQGAWIGAAFENQNQHLEYKYTDWKNGNMSAAQGKNFVNEVYEKKGSYPLAQMSSNTVEQLKQQYKVAQIAGDNDTMSKIEGITETFMHDMSSGGQIGDVEGQPIIGPDGRPMLGADGRPQRQASTPGAAHISERVRELASMTGVGGNLNPRLPPSSGAAPSGEYGADHAPTANNRAQK